VSSSIRPPYSVTLSTLTCCPASTYVPRLSIFFSGGTSSFVRSSLHDMLCCYVLMRYI
jgi:hypothetical protein